MESILQVAHVYKNFGEKEVLKDLSFCVKEHSIYGFIGENGAGKTTTMKLILGLLKLQKGEIYVGKDLVTYGNTKTNRLIGYLPDVPEFYDFMSGYEYLIFCINMLKVDTKGRNAGVKKAEELLEMVGLKKDHVRIKGYSRGMKQRLGIAQALLNEPKLFICDEPTSALDPKGRKEVLDIMQAVKEKTTVLFSTHVLSDVERTCTEVGVLAGKTIALSGSIKALQKQKKSSGFEIEFLRKEEADQFLLWFDEKQKELLNIEEEKRAFAHQACEGKVQKEDAKLIYPNAGDILYQAAFALCQQKNLFPIQISKRESTLEDLFLEVTRR